MSVVIFSSLFSVILLCAPDGHVQAFPRQEMGEENDLHSVFPQFCSSHEVTCPGGVYRLAFFGPRMHEQGYKVQRAEEKGC